MFFISYRYLRNYNKPLYKLSNYINFPPLFTTLHYIFRPPAR